MIELLQAMTEAAFEAGAEIMRLYQSGCDWETKPDGSYVCEADRRAEAVILKRLNVEQFGPAVCEEEAGNKQYCELGSRFFLVDALDGTRPFLERSGEFSVNIGLVQDSYPLAGAIFLPLEGLLYWGALGMGAFRGVSIDRCERISARTVPPEGATLITSQPPSSSAMQLFRRLGVANVLESASARNFCYLAEGAADIYPRFGHTREWDTAAGHAILAAAGGRVEAMVDGCAAGELSYGKAAQGFSNPHFIARGLNGDPPTS